MERIMTPFEHAERFAKNLQTTLEIAQALAEIDDLTDEERAKPETQAMIEILTIALSALMGTVAEA
jgi:hypothetical protein